MIRFLSVAALFSFVLESGVVRGDSCCLRGDVDQNSAIQIADVAPFVGGLLDPGSLSPAQMCAADVNADGSIDGRDVDRFVDYVINPSLAHFDYGPTRPNAEAEQIALEFLGSGGALVPSDDLYNRIDRDLALIRAHTPALATQTHNPAWVPNQLIAEVLVGVPHDQYNCLNTYYQLATEEFLCCGDLYTLTFARNSNVEALAAIYDAAPEVGFAEPNGIFGGENFWTPSDLGGGLWQWTVDDGFLDCFDGCDCHRQYTFQVDAIGTVMLVDYQEFGQPWCEF